jgi:hypothetical protein
VPRAIFFVPIVCALSTGAAGCSKRESPRADDTKTLAPYAPLPPAIKSDRAANTAATGSITGRVVFTGPKPEPATLPGRADPGCPGRPAKSDEVVINPNGTLRDTLVRIAPGSIKDGATPTSPVVLTQKDCTYSPKVAGALVGATLQIHNADRTAHDVRIIRGERTVSNQSVAASAKDLSETDLTSEVGLLKIESTTHPWMAAFVVVSDNPFFQTTGADGTFKLEGLAPGTYSVEAWHPKYGTRSTSLPVVAGQAIDVAFGFDGPVPN